MSKSMTMRKVIFAAALAALLPTAEAWSQGIDWGKKSLSLDTGLSEDAVTKILGQSPMSAEVAVCSGHYGSLTGGPVTCKILLFGRNGEMIVRFKKESDTWLSYSWSVNSRP